MYRHPSLRHLSREHHAVLQLARAIQPGVSARLRATLPADPAELAVAVERTFITEIDPHMRAEEEVLVPAIEHRSPALAALATELRVQHAAIRHAFVAVQLAREPAGPLADLGAELEQHVRWEERALFPAIQDQLGDDALAELTAPLAALA